MYAPVSLLWYSWQLVLLCWLVLMVSPKARGVTLRDAVSGPSTSPLLMKSFDFDEELKVYSSIPQESIMHQLELQRHGTTTLAFIHGKSVILCIDSKASMGSYVSSRNVKKIFPLGFRTVATMAGGAADCSFWIRKVANEVKLLEDRYATTFTVHAKARLLSLHLKEYRGRDLSVGTMVAGFDKHGTQLYYVDSEGSCISGELFCVGSGSKLAYSVLDSEGIKDKEGLTSLSRDEAIRIATWAVRHATFRDGFSGGYINVLEVNELGVKHVQRIDSRNMPI